MRRAILLGCAIAIASCRKAPPAPTTVATATRAPARFEVAASIFDGGLHGDWKDYGWSKRDFAGPGPAKVDFGNYGGWIIAHPGLTGRYGGLTFRAKMPPGEGDFLEVRVDSTDDSHFPRIKISPQHRLDSGDGWTEVLVPMAELDPDDAPFDRVVFHAFRPVGSGEVFLDKIALTVAPPSLASQDAGADGGISYAAFDANATEATLKIDGRATARKISPAIYGIAFDSAHNSKDSYQWAMSPGARRWGGNATTRYNWQIHARNTAYDWFWENVETTPYTVFLSEDVEHKVMSALTVPTIGWVAKDSTSCSFPTNQFPPQKYTEGDRCGNGRAKDGNKELEPKAPTMTSIAETPDFVKKWVEAIVANDAKTGKRSVDEYILDNEPGLWHETHRDVHPEPLTYDEELAYTIAYGSAIRAADPGATIAGPAAWGWPEYQFSAKDKAVGFRLKPDRLAHGDVPLIPWYLRKLKEHEAKTGVRVLDVLDVHYYPQVDYIFGSQEKTDAKTAATRIRVTRSLWDPTYKDESWIDDTVQLIPRLQKWIDDNYPGRGISIGEYNFGGADHMSGALAEAEVLGRFGQLGVASAYYWTYPKENSPAFWAFRAFRNFDAKGARFQDWSLPTEMANGVSLYASRDESGKKLVAVALNMGRDVAMRAKIAIAGAGHVASARALVYAGGPLGFKPVPADSVKAGEGEITVTLPPYSITVIDASLADALAGGIAR